MSHKKLWRDLVGGLALEAKQKERLKGLYEKCHVHFHISVGDNRRHDSDNLNWAVQKPAMDGLVGVLLVDDSIDHVTVSFSYDREKPRRFTITINGL